MNLVPYINVIGLFLYALWFKLFDQKGVLMQEH